MLVIHDVVSLKQHTNGTQRARGQTAVMGGAANECAVNNQQRG